MAYTQGPRQDDLPPRKSMAVGRNHGPQTGAPSPHLELASIQDIRMGETPGVLEQRIVVIRMRGRNEPVYARPLRERSLELTCRWWPACTQKIRVLHIPEDFRPSAGLFPKSKKRAKRNDSHPKKVEESHGEGLDNRIAHASTVRIWTRDMVAMESEETLDVGATSESSTPTSNR